MTYLYPRCRGEQHDMVSELGPTVTVLRTLMNGDQANENLPAMLAVSSVMFDPRNGVEFRSAKILWGEWADLYSSSGGGFAGMLRRDDEQQ